MRRFLYLNIIFIFLGNISAFSQTDESLLNYSQTINPQNQTSQPPVSQTLPSIDIHEPIFPINIEEANKQNDRFLSELINMLATLGLIIGLILIVAWFLKRLVNTRLEQHNEASSIKILEKRILSAKTTLYLIEVNQKVSLLGESQNGIFPLNASSIDESTTTKNSASAFSKVLDKKDGKI